MAVKNTIKAIPYSAIAATTLSAVYQPFSLSGLPAACFMLRINNLSNSVITISYDGTNDHDQIDTRDTLQVYGGWGSSQPNNNTALWSKGQLVYVKGTVGTGTITLCGYYQPKID